MKSARRIVGARRNSLLRFEDLKKMGVVLKRAMYFITCGGKMLCPLRLDEDFLAGRLIGEKRGAGRESGAGRKSGRMEGYLPEGLLPEGFLLGTGSVTYRQLSLFDDVNFGPEKDERTAGAEQSSALLCPGG